MTIIRSEIPFADIDWIRELNWLAFGGEDEGRSSISCAMAASPGCRWSLPRKTAWSVTSCSAT